MLNLMVKVFSKCKKLNANVLVMMYFLILLTDLSIILNIPLVRQILGLLCFSLLPGWLILNILRIDKKFLVEERLVLSVGLSIAFLMFGGLLVNSCSLFIPKPLSLFPLLGFFNIFLAILVFLAYKRNKEDFDIKNMFNFRLDVKNKLISPFVFPILFPLMAISGDYLMNTQGNNVILLVMLFLIPIYVVAIVILTHRIPNRIPEATYSVALWMIGLSLLLMSGLRYSNISGAVDVHIEYYVFKLTQESSVWNIAKFHHPYNACLSVTILPLLYSVFLNIKEVYIYKLLYQVLFSLTPVVVYIFSARYMCKLHAFFSSLFFMFQFYFIYSLPSILRQEIATLLFFVSIVVLFDDRIGRIPKKIMLLILIVATTVAHYSTAYIFFILMLSSWLIINIIETNHMRKEFKQLVTADFLILFFITMFFWYGQLTESHIYNLISFFESIVNNLGGLFLAETRSKEVDILFGYDLLWFPDKIMRGVVILTSICITIGILRLLIKGKAKGNREPMLMLRDKRFITMAVISEVLLIASLILPYVSKGYGLDRMYMQLLIFLAPVFVLGAKTIGSYFKSCKIFILLVLLLQFLCGSLLIYQLFGIPYSFTINTKGPMHSVFYVPDQDLFSLRWVNTYGRADTVVYGDKYIYYRFLDIGVDRTPYYSSNFFKENKPLSRGYIYLRCVNTVDGIVFNTFKYRENMNNSLQEYLPIIENSNKIYDNGGSKIYGAGM